MMIIKKLFTLFSVGLLSLPASAVTLSDLYFLAIKHDPTFNAAVKEQVAGKEYENIGLSQLLPSIQVNYQNNPRSWQRKVYPIDIFQGEIRKVEYQNYQSYSVSAIISQPLFDYTAFSEYKASVIKTLLADSHYQTKFSELIIRLIDNYIQIAYAQDKLLLNQAQQEIYQKQLASSQRLFELGEGTKTDIAEIETRLYLTQSQYTDLQLEIEKAKNKLSAMIGSQLPTHEHIAKLTDTKFVLQSLAPDDYSTWEKNAIQNNLNIQSARHEMAIAKQEIEKNRGEFFPTVQLYASYSNSDSDSNNTINQKYQSANVGFYISMPLFNGGKTTASMRQSTAKYQMSAFERDAIIQNIRQELRHQYQICTTSHIKLKAFEQSVSSAKLQLNATRKSYIGGQRTMVDVLNAEELLYRAQQDLIKAKYDYIQAWALLHQYTNTLDIEKIKIIENYFQ
ncbi:TPA: TolC family outer membrane protein [Proteus mirabilis]|uniref:TolC family outer membrane protein n=1 Tax=Proteus mirabilis TaxID=584 RepID=UPI0018C68998|nr:TolC family outer membrane protein [Proteus mirabilis]MBG6042921.1 TolC family outer membrane protein [Proteus mirabilis]MCY9776410.1 TolC family outer membrane protein [Proteus mirabilis]MCY9781187.1 TolC family outer membrane protein [Proteus mirabilis]MCY9788220.1 TolC family outer membrane protein [Proteus mirabilis]HBC5916287.1 TolC family outer membrane protein [Proteus mirabilis]